MFTIQETHYAKKGKFKLDKFVIFESIRKSRMKGGSMLGVHVDLNPVLVKEFSDDFELLVVEVKAGNTLIRIIPGYGPQENWDYKDKTLFFEALDSEIACSELEGKPVIISSDANSKLGSTFIENDPHEQSRNGKLLADIIERHALIVVNGVKEKCVGLITRERHTVDGTEKSVINFVITSSTLIKHIEKMHIDDRRVNVLKSLLKKGDKKLKKTESDHNIIHTKLNIPWTVKCDKPYEVFNFKDKTSQETFFSLTNETETLAEIFDSTKTLDMQIKKFLKRLDGFVHQCF